MLIDTNFFNNKNNVDLLNQTINDCQFYSIDFEMSGIELDLSTKKKEYDFPQLRYEKMKKIVEEYSLTQIGVSFYLPKTKHKLEESNIENKENIKEKAYLERTYSAYLFKSSPFKFLSDMYRYNKSFSFFEENLKCNAQTLKFMAQNSFDFDSWLKHSHHYNKLNYNNKINELISLYVKQGIQPDKIVSFSSKSIEKIMKCIYEIIEFIITPFTTNNNTSKKVESDKLINEFSLKRKHEVNCGNEFYSQFIVSLNLSNILLIKNISIIRNKDNKEIINIDKLKQNISLIEFYKKFDISENSLKTNKEKIKEIIDFNYLYNKKYMKYLLSDFEINKSINSLDNSLKTKEDVINDHINNCTNNELGFTNKFITQVINSKKPLIGHNLDFDIMFLYNSFINDLPELFEDYIKEINLHFPIIIDTKVLSDTTGYFDKTTLKSLDTVICKNKYNSYIDIVPDIENGFCLYDYDNKHHDAGYDARLTGRCFIAILKAIENNFIVDNSNSDNKNVTLVDFNTLKSGNKKVINIVTFNHRYDFPLDYFNFENYDTINQQHKLIVEKYSKYIIIVKFNSDILNIFNIKDIINDLGCNYEITKASSNSVYLEICSGLLYNDTSNSLEEISNIIKNKKEVAEVIDYKTFVKNFKSILFK